MLFFVLAGWGWGFAEPDQLDWDAIAMVGPSTVQHCADDGFHGNKTKWTACATGGTGGLASQIGPIVFNYACKWHWVALEGTLVSYDSCLCCNGATVQRCNGATVQRWCDSWCDSTVMVV